MSTLAAQVVSVAGLAPAFVAAAVGGDNFVPGEDVYLHVKNGGGSPITVMVVTPGTVRGGVAIADPTVSVPAAGERKIGPFPSQLYADPNGSPKGNVFVTYSGVTTVTVGVFQVQEV